MGLITHIFVLVLAVASSTVQAKACTPTERETMLDAIRKNPSWPACVNATTPFSFLAVLTEETMQEPTSAQLRTFLATPACTTVYQDFQESLRQANCDDIKSLIGLTMPELISQIQPEEDEFSSESDDLSGSGSGSSTNNDPGSTDNGSNPEESAPAPTTTPKKKKRESSPATKPRTSVDPTALPIATSSVSKQLSFTTFVSVITMIVMLGLV